MTNGQKTLCSRLDFPLLRFPERSEQDSAEKFPFHSILVRPQNLKRTLSILILWFFGDLSFKFLHSFSQLILEFVADIYQNLLEKHRWYRKSTFRAEISRLFSITTENCHSMRGSNIRGKIPPPSVGLVNRRTQILSWEIIRTQSQRRALGNVISCYE